MNNTKQLLDLNDELWYKFFQKTDNYYDMLILDKYKSGIPITDLKKILQDYHITNRHFIRLNEL